MLGMNRVYVIGHKCATVRCTISALGQAAAKGRLTTLDREALPGG